MNYCCTFLNSVHGIELDFEIDDFLSEDIGLRLCNKSTFVSDFYEIVTVLLIGTSQLENSQRLKIYFFNQFAAPIDDFKQENLLSYLLNVSAYYCHSLWLIKDNSVRFNTGHLKYSDESSISIHSNFINSLFSDCMGDKTITKFSAEEINNAKKYFKFLLKLNHKQDKNEPEHTYAEVNRIKRAFYFVDVARRSFDIGMKVSLFCSALECLFSISQSELKHRMSETIANFLEIEFEAKKDIYTKAKVVYDLRSSITHGSGIAKKLINNEASKLKEIGRNCDDILRRCLTKIISDDELVKLYFENNNEKIEEYMTDINFK